MTCHTLLSLVNQKFECFLDCQATRKALYSIIPCRSVNTIMTDYQLLSASILHFPQKSGKKRISYHGNTTIFCYCKHNFYTDRNKNTLRLVRCMPCCVTHLAYLCEIVDSNLVHQVGIFRDIELCISLFPKAIFGLDCNACRFMILHLTNDPFNSR